MALSLVPHSNTLRLTQVYSLLLNHAVELLNNTRCSVFFAYEHAVSNELQFELWVYWTILSVILTPFLGALLDLSYITYFNS